MAHHQGVRAAKRHHQRARRYKAGEEDGALCVPREHGQVGVLDLAVLRERCDRPPAGLAVLRFPILPILPLFLVSLLIASVLRFASVQLLAGAAAVELLARVREELVRRVRAETIPLVSRVTPEAVRILEAERLVVVPGNPKLR